MKSKDYTTMKKKLIGALAIVAIAAMAAFNLNINAGNDNLSTISMDNIEILAWGEGQWGCANNPTWIQNEALTSVNCGLHGWATGKSKLKCESKTGVCCDPSKQSNC